MSIFGKPTTKVKPMKVKSKKGRVFYNVVNQSLNFD